MNHNQILLDFEASLDLSGDSLRTKWEENSSLEFKRALHTRSEEIDKSYLPTISGLANNRGGIIVFGVENKTNILIGIKHEYENLDNKYFASTIRSGLDGSLEYFFITGKFLGKVIGFLYIEEASSKPVILKTSSEGIVRGEIYFRYPAQTTRIEPSDLRKIISEEVQNKLENTLKLIHKVADIGADKLAIINTENGELDLGESVQTKLVLSKETLKNLNIIRKGKIIEEGGADAYTIRGELDIEIEESEFSEKHIPTLTKETEIYESFFSGVCEHSEIMLQQLLYHRSQYNPLHFFILQSGLSSAETKLFFENIIDRNVIQTTKDKIIERIYNSEYTTQGAIINEVKHCFTSSENSLELIDQVKNTLGQEFNNKDQQIVRTICLNTLKSGNSLPEDIYKIHLIRAIEAISHLNEIFIRDNKSLIIRELEYIYRLNRKSSENTIMRKVICNVDKALYEKQLEAPSISEDNI